ncbi:MAG: hypothetical protein WA277_13895 [Nitrospirota bacterium]
MLKCITDPNAIKFQRLTIASLSFLTLVLQRIEPIYAILLLTIPGLIGGARIAPAILIYHGISRILGRPFLKVSNNQRSSVMLFAQSPGLDRFIYGLFTITSIGLVALYSAWPIGVWISASSPQHSNYPGRLAPTGKHYQPQHEPAAAAISKTAGGRGSYKPYPCQSASGNRRIFAEPFG